MVIFQVVFLNRGEPDLEFEGLLKREKTRVTYFQGTMLKYVGLDAEAGVDVEVEVDVDAYLIFVIFFTPAKFLENKIYTEK